MLSPPPPRGKEEQQGLLGNGDTGQARTRLDMGRRYDMDGLGAQAGGWRDRRGGGQAGGGSQDGMTVMVFVVLITALFLFFWLCPRARDWEKGSLGSTITPIVAGLVGI